MIYKTIINIVFCLIWGLILGLPTYAQCKLPPLGVFRIYGNTTKQFKSFKEMNITFSKGINFEAIVPDDKGRIFLSGWVRTFDDKLLEFQEIILQQHKNCFYKLYFKTVELDGVSFKFEGEYYAKSQRRKRGYVQLKGALQLYKNGIKIAELKSDFEKWTSSELIIN